MSLGSWQARAMSRLLRGVFKPRLARARSAAEARALMARIPYLVPAGVKITAGESGGIAGEWVESAASGSREILLYLHGGGYFACSPRTHRPITTAFARLGFRVFAPDYRLAPEFPFPAGLNDAAAAYYGLRHGMSGGEPVLVAGDSAGGGMALALLLKVREEGGVLPAAGALFSPYTDLVGAGASRRANERRCAMFRTASFATAASFYLSGADPRTPLASPLYADLRGLPPLMIEVGEDETLLDDSTQFAERARAAGVPVRLTVWPAVPHVWQLLHPFIPEGRRSLGTAAGFLSEAARAWKARPAAVSGVLA